MIVITQKPTATILGETSIWNAAGNPIVYKLQRKDQQFNQVNNNGGFVQLQFNGVNLVSFFTVSDSIYVKSDNGVYASYGTVTARVFSGGNTLVTTDQAYTSAATTGFTNNDTQRADYRVSIDLVNASNVPFNPDPIEYQPDPTGYLLLNVSGIVRSLILPDNNTALSSFGCVDDSGIYLSFYLGYTEIWESSANVQSIDTQQVIAVLGSLQIPSTYGGNLAEYSSFNDGGPIGKWLTKLTTPVMWRGWPFSLDAIINEGVSGNIYVDAGSNTSTPALFSGKVISAVLTGATDSANDTFTVSIKRSTGPTQIVETKTIEVQEPCQNPVLLMARNSLGGTLFWMFDFNQEYRYDYGDGRKAKRLLLYTNNLTINRWQALQEFITLGDVYRNSITEFTSSTIKTSSRIGQQVYVVNQDGTKVGVIALPANNSTQTRRQKHFFELEIEFPEEFAV